MKTSGIYKIQSIKKSERIYIGSAVNIFNRWACHLKNLRKNKHHSPKLQNHFNKYGASDLHFSILLGCEKEDLIKAEQYFIDSYNPYFNICKKAGSALGVKHSEDTKRKISQAKKGKPSGRKGIPMSNETKKKLSELRKGLSIPIEKRRKNFKHTKEWKHKHSERMKGSGNSMFGKHQTKESKYKNRLSNIGKHNGCKNKFYGKHHSEETKQKMKLSWINRKNNKIA